MKHHVALQRALKRMPEVAKALDEAGAYEIRRVRPHVILSVRGRMVVVASSAGSRLSDMNTAAQIRRLCRQFPPADA